VSTKYSLQCITYHIRAIIVDCIRAKRHRSNVYELEITEKLMCLYFLNVDVVFHIR
jgi:hypothetical protein